MCVVFTLLENRKNNAELRELLRLENVSLVTRKDGLRWSGHVEHNDDIIGSTLGCQMIKIFNRINCGE